MSGARVPGALSRPEIDRLLRRPILARLATVDPDGYPGIVPVWHDWDGEAAWLVARAEARRLGVEIECERMDAVTGHDLREQVGTITAPTLVLCARDDGITPLPLSEELARRIPGARLEVLATGSHFAPACVADDWAGPVLEFLQ